MNMKLIFCCLLAATTVYGSEGFYFPDQVEVKAQSSSDSWSDGFGNSHANANGNALASQNGGGSSYPDFYRPSGQHGQDYGGRGPYDFADRYPAQGFNPGYDGPQPPYSHNQYPLGGQSEANANALANTQGYGFGGNSNANAQANSQNYNGKSISNAIAGSQSLGANGAASASAAAASAGTSFVNGIPVASAAAASSASAASPHGGASASSSSNANSGGAQYPGFYNIPYDNYNQRLPFQSFSYRSGGSDDSKESVVVEADENAKSDNIVFKSD